MEKQLQFRGHLAEGLFMPFGQVFAGISFYDIENEDLSDHMDIMRVMKGIFV